MIAVELGERFAPSTCECCGQPIESCYGLLYRDGVAFAVYHAAWSYAHLDHGAAVAIEVAETWAASHCTPRVAFGLRVESGADDIGITLVDGEDTPWGGDPAGCRLLWRDEALAHPLKAQVLEATAQLLHDDPQVRRFLERCTPRH